MPTAVPGHQGSAVVLLLLGCFRLKVDGGAVHLSHGAQRLLAALALRGELDRGRLAGMLWPETSRAQARTNLRHVLWRVHAAAPQHRIVEVDDGMRLGAEVACDVARLEAEARRVLHSGAPPHADGMLTRDFGELLPDWDEEWVLSERERIRQRQLHAWDAWAEALVHAGSYGRALDVALMALQADALRESAHRTVIRIHQAEGNLAEARRCLERCHRMLAAELGVEPSAETLALASEVGARRAVR